MRILNILMGILLFSSLASGIENQPIQPSNDDIIYFSIGGKPFVTYRSTIESSDIDLLKIFISGKFALKYDRDGNIFIDYDTSFAL